MTECQSDAVLSRPPSGRRSLRVRLVIFISVAMVVVCAAIALTTVLVQRAYALGDLDERVTDAAERSQGGLQRRPGGATDLGLLNERGQPVGTLAARLADGHVVAAEVVTEDGGQQVLTAAQRAALDGITTDGTLHTRTVPGLTASRPVRSRARTARRGTTARRRSTCTPSSGPRTATTTERNSSGSTI